jgi:hypothetical protein
MFGLGSGLLVALQWLIFALTIAAIVYVAVKIAGMAKASRKGKWITGIAVGAVTFLILNVPNWQAMVGRMYFDNLCKTEAGEFIYKTVDNVEGLYQMRQRDPRDYLDRMQAGDVPEDPFGHTNFEAQHPQFMFVAPPSYLYQFFENDLPEEGAKVIRPLANEIVGKVEADAKYRRYHGNEYREKRPMIEDRVASLTSRYGFTWRGIYHEYDQLFGVIRWRNAGCRSTVERNPGAASWVHLPQHGGGICPAGKTDQSLYRFISQVLKPPASASASAK